MKLVEYIKNGRCAFVTERGTDYRVVFIDSYFEIQHEKFCNTFGTADFYAKKWVDFNDDVIQ